MLLKAAAVLGGMFFVVIGGVVTTKYGKSWFGSGSEKMKLWIDEKGKCKYEGKSSFFGSANSEEARQAAEEAKTDGLCTRIFKNNTSEIDWSKVEIYWKNTKTTYEDAKKEWEKLNQSSNP